jgi:hypothetical protein
MRTSLRGENFGRGTLHVDIEPLSDVLFHAEATLQAIRGLRTLAWTFFPCVSSVCADRRNESQRMNANATAAPSADDDTDRVIAIKNARSQ